MFSFTIADRDFPLRLIAGLNERAREDTHSITAVWPCSMSTSSRASMRRAQLIDVDHAAAVSFAAVAAGNTAMCAVTDTPTSTIGEAAKWTIEKSGTMSPLFKAGVLL